MFDDDRLGDEVSPDHLDEVSAVSVFGRGSRGEASLIAYTLAQRLNVGQKGVGGFGHNGSHQARGSGRISAKDVNDSHIDPFSITR
jgi:hypothetical protein